MGQHANIAHTSIPGAVVTQDDGSTVGTASVLNFTNGTTTFSNGTATVNLSSAGGGAVATDAIWDAKGDLAVGTASNAASRLAAGADGLVLTLDAAQALGVKWANAARFKHTQAIGSGDITFSSTSKAAIDATDLAYLTLTLAVNDVVRCTFSGQLFTSSTQGVGIDFEVDQPTSGNVFVANAAEFGLASFGNAANRRIFTVVGMFTATEAGSHGFRPAALVASGSATFCNATSGQSDTALTFIVENLGPVTA